MRNGAVGTIAFVIATALLAGCAPEGPEEFEEAQGAATYPGYDPNLNWEYDSNGYVHYTYGMMMAGQRLFPGDYLTYSNIQLKLQGDCNLVLSVNGKATWASHTDRALWCHATMQTDGNFVVYDDGPNRAVWDTKTAGKGAGAYLNLLPWDPPVFCVMTGKSFVKQFWACEPW